MADRTSLGLLGLVFGGVTAAVILTAATIVFSHVQGQYVLESAPTALTTTVR